jgi:hypothetical protein
MKDKMIRYHKTEQNNDKYATGVWAVKQVGGVQHFLTSLLQELCFNQRSITMNILNGLPSFVVGAVF